MTDPVDPPRPLLQVVRGEPTPEELAALVAVVAARSAAAASAGTPERPRPAGWASKRPALRRAVHVGPGEWAASGFEAGTRTRADW